ncbi:MAG: hypothetical protein D6785_14225 [Planctomycetota bacterium]|nr:MAG: hypothetical protein D6785_14225 [Planctomycetota bacterium]
MVDENQGQTPQPTPEKMSPPEKSVEPKTAAKPKKREEVTHVTIRPLPKIVFMYPSCVMGIVAAIWQTFSPESPWPGLLFMGMLMVNFLILSFEFSRASSVSLVLGLCALAFLGMYIGDRYNIQILNKIVQMIQSLHLQANESFYWTYSLFLVFIFVLVYIRTRFDYWVVTHNELLHYHGIMGNVERYPAPNLRVSKEIEDVFEFLLLQSGRLVITPASEQRSIILDNVPRVNKVEKKLNELLSKIIVKTQ